jgi:hypothetical protein
LAQIILGGKGFKFVQMKVIALPQGEIMAKSKSALKIFKNLLQNQTNVVQIILG